MDVVGSALALIICSPLFLMIAAAIKLTSKGPVIFRQERMGQFGKSFTCLKFRTMYVDNDLTIHKEFMTRVIHGNYKGNGGDQEHTVYKMIDDPRITKVGRFLRRTSLDELPQFINVLEGEMSLVGPRPPLAYEFQQYDLWHRRRVVEVKPGITGLWQVNGRSRVRFDEMVRLDLRYVRTCSFWLDIQILLQTPKAVFHVNDAF
jgi:lipopolysaccharide/colanic/teichoic acid biosynthesis glycosyltransferase